MAADIPLLDGISLRSVSPVFANVSFGIFALMPLGWAFMLLVIALESWVLSRRLFAANWHGRAAAVALTANAASGAAGFGLSLWLNGGWWLVIWLPWVSRHEVDPARQLLALTAYYLGAFLLSVVIEAACAQWMLRRTREHRKVWQACLLANVASYAVGSVLMYSWSFGLLG